MKNCEMIMIIKWDNLNLRHPIPSYLGWFSDILFRIIFFFFFFTQSPASIIILRLKISSLQFNQQIIQSFFTRPFQSLEFSTIVVSNESRDHINIHSFSSIFHFIAIHLEKYDITIIHLPSKFLEFWTDLFPSTRPTGGKNCDNLLFTSDFFIIHLFTVNFDRQRHLGFSIYTIYFKVFSLSYIDIAIS